MGKMHRTQIYLDPAMSSSLDRLARKRGTTRAQLIRLAMQRFLDAEAVTGEDPILGIIGIGESGDSHISRDHDAVLASDEIASWTK